MNSILIAHISDLHFGAKEQDFVWDKLKNRLRKTPPIDLLFVTGDIVDTPSDEHYKNAAKELGDITKNYFVCPGNHDRHPSGVNFPGRTLWNRLAGTSHASTGFEAAFISHIPDSENPATKELGEEGNKWKLRIVAIDSSLDARYLAQGFIHDRSKITLAMPKLEDKTNVPDEENMRDEDLAICLVHHHLLSVPKLEAKRQKLKELLRPTQMVNAGLVLEALTEAHVDLALHGHEHCCNFARYGTYQARRDHSSRPHTGDDPIPLTHAEIAVLGAASGTGASPNLPCEQTDASFNLLELRPDRSVWVTEIRYTGTDWQEQDPVQLWDALTLKRARFLRQKSARTPEIEIVRHIIFEPQRDIFIHEQQTNRILKDRWNFSVTNSTGYPESPKIDFHVAGSPPYEAANAKFRSGAKENEFHCEVSLPNSNSPVLVNRIDVEFVWKNGALLTMQDMALLKREEKDKYRTMGYEFGGVVIPDVYVRSVLLTVTIPAEFRPPDVTVFVEEPTGSEPKEDLALKKSVRASSKGMYSLAVAYPKKNCCYVIAWKVPKGEQSTSDGKDFNVTARKNGDEFVAAFGNGLAGTFLEKMSGVSLYVPNLEQPRLEFARVGRASPDDWPLPPCSVPGAVSNLYTQAWWGVPRISIAISRKSLSLEEVEREDVEEAKIGLLKGEKALIVLPVKPLFSERGRAGPWGLIRIGIVGSHEDKLQEELTKDIERVWKLLGKGMVLMLNKALF